MIKINDKKFEIYDIDTSDAILRRIAENFKTIPKYLYINEFSFPYTSVSLNEWRNTKNITVTDLASIIINASKKDEDFSILYDDIKTKSQIIKLDTVTDIIQLYISYSSVLQNIEKEFIQTIMLQIEDNIKASTGISIDVKNMYDNKDYYINSLLDKISENSKIVDEQKKIQTKIDKMEGINIIDFTLENVKTILIATSKENEPYILSDLFNDINLSQRIPFCTFNNYVKLNRDFVPFVEWENIIDYPNVIILKIFTPNDFSNLHNPDDYSTIFLKINKLENDVMNEVQILTNMTLKPNYITKEEYISNIEEIFSNRLKIEKDIQKRLNGNMYIPNEEFNKFVFADLVMNNSLFSKSMIIDETKKASSKRSNLYIYFKYANIGKFAFSISQQISHRKDKMYKQNRNVYELNSPYIKIRVTYADNMDSINSFIAIFSKLFAYYKSEYLSVYNFYKKFTNEIDEKKEYNIYEKTKFELKDIEPDIFVNDYPRKCNAKYQPILADRNTEYNDEDINFSHIPLTEIDISKGKREGIIYPREDSGYMPRKYICPTDEYPYPGLKKNNLENKDKFPYIMCCYKKNQKDKGISAYKKYYLNVEKNKNHQQQHVLVTNKILYKNNYGLLPTNIDNFFNLIKQYDNIKYVRKGVYRGKNSFIECVLECVGYEFKSYNEHEIQRELKKTRIQFATTEFASLCKQELYDMSIENIVELIKNQDEYFDPKYFIRILEEYFNCNIYLFSNNEMFLPRFLNNYCKFYNNKKCIFIIEHIGSESDNAKYPQCEIICSKRIENNDILWRDVYDEKIIFDYKNVISKEINDVYEKMIEYSIVDRIIYKIHFDITNVTIIEQQVDSYGKCRHINARIDDTIFTILTDPIAPLLTNINHDIKIHRINHETLLRKVAPLLNVKIIGKIEINDNILEIIGVIGNVNVSFPIELINSKRITSAIPTLERNISHGIFLKSNFSEYLNLKKISLCLVEYTIWSYARFCDKRNIELTNISSVKLFASSSFVIIKEHEYGFISKIFSYDSKIFDDKKRIIAHSNEIIRRLIYILRQTIERNLEKVKRYMYSNIMENYYTDINDFDYKEKQTIIEGKTSMNVWIREKIYKNTVSSVNVQPYGENNIPYLFKNINISNKLYIAQNVKNIDDGLYIGKQWIEEMINKNMYLIDEKIDTEDKNIPYILYLMYSENNIRKISTNDGKISIIISIQNDEPVYTVLLEL